MSIPLRESLAIAAQGSEDQYFPGTEISQQSAQAGMVQPTQTVK
jgi:hypothetical protein